MSERLASPKVDFDAPVGDGSAKKAARRVWLKRTLIALAIITPVALGGLWIAVHSIPWMGPLVANSLRAIVGKENVTRLEDFVYGIEDRVNRTLKSGERPKAYWQVEQKAPPRPPAPAPSAAADASALPPPKPPFHPSDVGPVVTGFGAEGDGTWVPMSDPRRPGEAPRLFKTLLHPDKSRSWSELFVVAVDLSEVEVMPVMGYQEPRSDNPAAQTYVRTAKVPEAHWDALLGAFNGGFMAEHGHHGIYFDGIQFIPPREDSCTLVRYADGSIDVASWTKIKDRQADMTWYRQAPSCMYEKGQMHPSLKVYHARKWGATLDGETVIRRSAVGISSDRQVLYVGISNHTNAKVMALGMHHAGADSVAQMDVNWSYPKFVTYEKNDKGQLVPVALAAGFEFDEYLYLRHRSMRDFFYLARKEEVTVRSATAAKSEDDTASTASTAAQASAAPALPSTAASQPSAAPAQPSAEAARPASPTP
jgi:hypothetical protein